MKFKYLDIVNTGNKKASDHIFAYQRWMDPNIRDDGFGDHQSYDVFRDSGYTLRNCMGLVGRQDGAYQYYTAANGSIYRVPTRVTIRLKYSASDLLSIMKAHPYLDTVGLKKGTEEYNAVVALIKVMKPEVDKPILISQIGFDDGIAGWNGLSIFVFGGSVGVFREGKFYSMKLEPGKNYKKAFEILSKEYLIGVEVTKKNYAQLLALVLEYQNKVKGKSSETEYEALKNTVAVLRSTMWSMRKGYRESLAAVKKLNEIRATLPKEIHILLKDGEHKANQVIEDIKSYSESSRINVKRLLQVKGDTLHIKECRKKIGQDFKAIEKLLKKGFIESIKYKTGEGLTWIYPAMTYDPKMSTFGKDIFLGRISVTLSDAGKQFKFGVLSYNNMSYYGTWHFDNRIYCLGSFEPVINNLIAMGQIANLIVVMKDYIQSANPDSRRIDPQFNNMRFDNGRIPAVTDDSFRKWVEKNPPKVAPTQTQTIKF